MRNNAKQFERLRGRWVLAARAWRGDRVFYTQKKMPDDNVLTATSFPTKDNAVRAIHFLKRRNPNTLKWWPYKVKDTELFKEVLRR